MSANNPHQLQSFISLLSFLFLFLLFTVPMVQAKNTVVKDLTLSLPQKDYYFTVGTNSLIVMNANNSYDTKKDGMLSYTTTQAVNQGNFQYSSSNKQSSPFSVDKGISEIPLSFGTSDSPMTLTVGFRFTFTDDVQREVVLDDISIHFVENNSQNQNQNQQNQQKQQNQQNKVSSSSQKVQSSSSSNQQEANDPFAQQEQRMQKLINQMTGQQQQQQTQTPQQALQNNQLPQDSSALKQQMQEQIGQQQKLQKEFQKKLAQNSEFQKEHQDLLSKGYNITGADFNPSSNDTGDFELNYKNPAGEKASLKGQMDKGNLTSLQKDTPESRQKLLNALEQDPRFQKYNTQLQQQGFERQDPEFTDFSEEDNVSSAQVKIGYMNLNNETAEITADFINDSVQDVELIQDNVEQQKINLWIVLIILLGIILAYVVYKKFSRHNKLKENKSNVRIQNEPPFDYKSEALSLLELAEELFAKKKYKDAYGTAGQAIRLFLSHKNNLKNEITNDEIVKELRQSKQPFKAAKACFDLCSLVEFAKYTANRSDFDKIIGYAKKTIG